MTNSMPSEWYVDVHWRKGKDSLSHRVYISSEEMDNAYHPGDVVAGAAVKSWAAIAQQLDEFPPDQIGNWKLRD